MIYVFELAFLFSLDKYPAVGLLDRMVVLFLIVLRRDGISLKKDSQISQLTDFLSYAVDKSQYF